MELSTLDIILIIPLAWGAYKGFKRGLVIEIASLLALILGVYGALNFSEFTAKYLNTHLTVDPYWMGIISFTLTFLAVAIAIHLIAKIVDKTLKFAALGMLIRLSGMFFGIIKFAIFLAVLLFIIEEFNARFEFLNPNWNADSLIYSGLSWIIEPIQDFLNQIEFQDLDIKL
jgi:membrane protein required for colicin V production